MINRLKSFLIIALCTGLLYGSEEISQKRPANEMIVITEEAEEGQEPAILVTLEDGQVQLSQREWKRLASNSETLQDMLSAIRKIGPSLPLPGVKKETFEILLKILKQSDATEAISKLRFEQQLDLWGCVNFLNIKFLLSRLDTIIAQGLNNNHNNLLTQFMQDPDYAIELLRSHRIDINSSNIGYAMIEPYLDKLWIDRFERFTDYNSPVAWSPNGAMIAAISVESDHLIYICNAQNWEALDELDNESSVYSLAWSPDSMRIAAALNDGEVIIWDLQNNNDILMQHQNSVNAIAWNPSGTMIASGSSDGNIYIWNAQDGTLMKTLGHADADNLPHADANNLPYAVNCVAWNFEGTMIASGATDGHVRIWNAQDGTLLRTLKGNVLNAEITDVHSVAWSADNKMLASSLWDEVLIWNAQDGKLLHQFKATSIVTSVAWNAKGAMILFVSGGDSINLLNIKDKSLTKIDSKWAMISKAAWSPDEKKIIAGSDDDVRIWDIQPLLFARHIVLLDALIIVAAFKNTDWLQSQEAQELISSQPWYEARKEKPGIKTLTVQELFDLIIQYEK